MRVRRTQRTPRLAASMASSRVSPSKGDQLATLWLFATAWRSRLGRDRDSVPADVGPWCIRPSRYSQSRIVTAQHE
jgi:hypothetical protein